MPKIQFGDPVAIELLHLEEQHKDERPWTTEQCGCMCPNCYAELEVCPYCGNKSVEQMYYKEKDTYYCKDCEKQAMSDSVYRKIQELKNRLNNQT